MSDFIVDDILAVEGFIPYSDGDKGDKGDKEIKENTCPIKNVFELLHKYGPIKKLKEFGLYQSNGIHEKCTKTEYTGKYIIDKKFGYLYLLSETYEFEKKVNTDGSITIDYHDIPLHFILHNIEIKDNDTHLDFSTGILESKYNYNIQSVTFKDNKVDDNMIDIVNTLSNLYKNHYHKFNLDVNKILIAHIYDSLRIPLKVKCDTVTVKIQMYNIYYFGGFFSSAYLYLA